MPAELRVAMLVWSYWPGHEGGAERQCRKLVPHLAAKGLEVSIWTAWTQRGHPRAEMQADHRIVRLGRWVPTFMVLRRGVDRLLSWVFHSAPEKARRRARLREAISFWIGLPLTMAARISFLLDIRRRLRDPGERPDLIHVQESSWVAGAAAHFARPFGIPVLAKTAVHPAWDVLGYDVPFRHKLSAARRECRFVALAPYLADNLAANGVPRERIFIVPNGVEISEPVRGGSVSKEVLFVANFSQSVEQKAFDVLLAAWAHVISREPTAQLLMVGAGDHSPWENMVKTLRLESSVVFTGWVPNPVEYYRRAALFVLPSRSEGMSNALLEAQSWGLPCVASDIPGNRAVVENGINGLVVSAGDAQALAEAILRLLADARLRSELGRNARQQAITRFSLDAVAGRLAGIYRQLARMPGTGGA
jgi:glycosyltransferase involved in cell wall biosynthesis